MRALRRSQAIALVISLLALIVLTSASYASPDTATPRTSGIHGDVDSGPGSESGDGNPSNASDEDDGDPIDVETVIEQILNFFGLIERR